MKGYLTVIATSLALGLSLTGPARAEGDLRSLMTADDNRGWEAVGRIDIGQSGFCTGALIAPDVVLTAAHCLFDPVSGARIPVEEITFLAGWRNGRANAYRGVRHAIPHPDYEYKGHGGDSEISLDIALLALDQPIRKASVTPFATGARPRKGAAVDVVSYARNRETRPAIQEDCHVLGRPGGTLVMSCNVDFGSSGAPVFSIRDGIPHIVSVVAAKGEVDGRPVSLGTLLEEHLPDLQTALMTARDTRPVTTAAASLSPNIRRVVSTGSSGAKFLRP